MKGLAPPLATALTTMLVFLIIAIILGSSGRPAHAVRPERSVDALTDQELIDALDDASASNPDRASQIAHKLWEQRKEIPRHDLTSAITDSNRSRVTRELMVDLLAGPPEDAQVTDEVRGLLRDRRLDPGIKARIIAAYDFGAKDTALLQCLASDPEDRVAFHALKKLGSADPAAARQLALAAIAKPERPSDSRLSASYKVLIRSGALRSDRDAKSALLHHLAGVLDDTKTSSDLRDSAALALSEMRSLDALRVLLDSQAADRILRVGAVDQNAALIKRVLEQEPDEATIELAVTAMELYPVTEIAQPLRAVRGRVSSPALLRRLDAAVAGIATQGVPLNAKWAED